MSLSLSLSLSLSPHAPHAQYRKLFRASYSRRHFAVHVPLSEEIRRCILLILCTLGINN